MKKTFDMRGKVILLTGGTGSFGNKCTEILLRDYKPKVLRIFSRDELKQFEMQQKFGNYSNLRFFLGDVRDEKRIHRAMYGVDVVIHAAALKQVPMLEYNPFEAIKTNVLGAENIINAAINQKVKRIIALSTDKASNPVNLYGATKLCMEKLFVAGNSYAGSENTQFAVVRYGNVVGSRGSVVPLFLKLKETGSLNITDENMTRFWITLEQGVKLVIDSIEKMLGGEIFIPKLPSMKITDLAEAIAPGCKRKIVGVRPGEKINEVLLTREESTHAVELKDSYIVYPDHPFWREGNLNHSDSKPVTLGFRYDSKHNDHWLTSSELKTLIGLKEEKVVSDRG